jgi:protein-S-isoprenylcysteine O-methyltransferase Ste14
MNQLKDWGFSAQWWRGEKGEYWVLGQTILSVLFVLLPAYPGLVSDNLSAIAQYSRWGVIVLGGNLTPLPHPKQDGTLVTKGIYRWVRHPLYSGVVFAAIAYSAWQWSLTQAIGSVVFLLFFDFKARKEELWLKNKFPDYHSYQLQVKKLIPWIY